MTFFALDSLMLSIRLEWFNSSLKITSPSRVRVEMIPIFAFYPFE